ncbi:ABC transporter ATP-binding protein [Pseudonocardia ailaonensis]|uniref:ABC transporter ATP-binding protein n=1 Tax=Pseudonocardia ailaonensis TaxID=367279 RepID=A0ABN2NA18_9PSEU
MTAHHAATVATPLPEAQPLLAVRDVTVRYGRFTALRDVTLDVREGAFHGVIGPNGAGKSTLMDAVTGSRRPAAGSVLFDGREIARSRIAARRRLGISRSFQRTSIFPELTVGEQLGLVGDHLGDQDVDAVLEIMSLAALRDRVAGTIAYGDQRRVDIALALLGKPRLLVLDEPAAGLSVEETDTLFEHLRTLVRERGVTALVVEHDVDAVFASCDTVTVLDLGQVLRSGDARTVRSDPAVIAAYLGSAA